MDTEKQKTFTVRAKETFHLGRLALLLVWRMSPLIVVGILLLLLLQAALQPLQLVLVKIVIDRIVEGRGSSGTTGIVVDRFSLPVWITLMSIVVGVAQLLRPLSQTLQNLAGDRLTGHVGEYLIRAANRWQGLERFEDPALADDLQRVRKGANRIGLELLTYGGQALLSLLTICAFALILIGLSPAAPLIICVATIPQMAVQWGYNTAVGRHLYDKSEDTRRLNYNREISLAPEPAKDVRLLNLPPFLRSRYEGSFERAMAHLDKLRRLAMVRTSAASLLSILAVGLTYLYALWLTIGETRSLGDLLLYSGSAIALRNSLTIVGNNIAFLPQQFGLFLPSLARLLESPSDFPLTESGTSAPRPILQGIVFEDVYFAYPGTVTPILQGLNFTIRPGESLALAGHNGIGKTTIIKLLLRMYDPTSGRILIDGTDLRTYDLADVRAQMSVIFQDFGRYELTIGENIGLGRVEVIQDQAQILTAAERAGIGKLVADLPDGLNTRLGHLFGGREVSGGEWQKLALARAFMRDSQVLILDEPTAAIDVETEYDLYSRFSELTRDRMTILISHRFPSIRMADRIIYLAAGRVCEEGSHSELLARNGEYARLYRLQARQYTVDLGNEDSQ